MHIHHQAITELIYQASEAIMDVYTKNQYQADLKEDHSPVTEADLVSHKIITEGLQRLYPEVPVLSEESAHPPYDIRKEYAYLWLLDPLDGTKEFINRTDEFSINLALIHKGKPVAGYIHLPVFRKLYYAIHKKGAFEIAGKETRRIEAARFSLQDSGLKVVGSRSHMDDLTKEYIDKLTNPHMISLGSALKFISIATGEAHYYPRMIQIMEWDTAAGQILIEEAGGSLVDADTGLPLRYNKVMLKNPYFIASGKQC
jgi:3'(2'), 5'-bisphosphate nucleotidase